MASPAPYLFVAAMDVDADKEDLFNEVYDTEHVPSLLEVPGVVAVTRYKTQDFTMSLGGEAKQVDALNPRYIATYAIEDPSVLASDAWAQAVELGRWPTEVRPYTRNRQHALHKVI